MAQATREHPYASFIHRVSKPSRYLGGEHGEVVKDPSSVDCSLCLAFPDVYDVGMSHLGFKILYSIVNGHPKLAAERAYAPWPDMEKELRAEGQPLRSLETFRALKDFDEVGCSLQFELSFSTVLLALGTGGDRLRSRVRGATGSLAFARGPTATHPGPLSASNEALGAGDSEQNTPKLKLTWAARRKAGMPRRERLVALAKLGVM